MRYRFFILTELIPLTYKQIENKIFPVRTMVALAMDSSCSGKIYHSDGEIKETWFNSALFHLICQGEFTEVSEIVFSKFIYIFGKKKTKTILKIKYT